MKKKNHSKTKNKAHSSGPQKSTAGGKQNFSKRFSSSGKSQSSNHQKKETRPAGPGRTLQAPTPKIRITKGMTTQGTVKRHPDGFGFLIPQTLGLPDIYVPKHEMVGVMTNDQIKVEVIAEHNSDRLRGKLIEVLARGTQKVIGRYQEVSAKMGLLKDESLGWGEDLVVERKAFPVKNRDWVSVQIVSHPGTEAGFRGEVVSVLGETLSPLSDVIRVIHTHQIPENFPKEALAEAEKVSQVVLESERKVRKDLRSLPIITIDGKTAKDFDDAIYVESEPTGFRLIVAIADVSHYVKPHSALDLEAIERGNSTYFPNFVVPMLPENLSNGICSLKPKVERLTLAADLKLNFQGEFISTQFYEAVICSHARVTYGEAQEVLDGSCPDSLKPVANEIRRAADLAKILMNKRFREGSINLEIPETEIELNEAGEPVDIQRSERLFSHKLIEELMLIANVAVAKFVASRGMDLMYRIHDKPMQDNVETLENYMNIFGSGQDLSGGNLQKKISRALQTFAGTPSEKILHILTLRTMMQAKYSPHNVGHFGLGFSDYAHFTSPIRRYADLIVHRVLKAAIQVPGYRVETMGYLETVGVKLSACEQRSVKAERQFHGIKKARFMERHLGEEFDGLISSVARFGAFVLLREFDVDGLVPIEELFTEAAFFDEEHLCLVGKRSGMTYNIGDQVRIQVAAVDTEAGKIDFVLATEGRNHIPFREVAGVAITEEKPQRMRPAPKQEPARKTSSNFEEKLDQAKARSGNSKLRIPTRFTMGKKTKGPKRKGR